MTVLEGEILDPQDPHEPVATRYPWGISWVCRCGRWEGAATGPSSAEWAAEDHHRHVTAETGGAAP